jgi:acyl-CoA thioesterase-2
MTTRLKSFFMSGVSALVDVLDLEPLEVNLFRGRSPQTGWPRVFGGQVIGQALVAATRTVEGISAHSMHTYFVLPGDPKVPIVSSTGGRSSS